MRHSINVMLEKRGIQHDMEALVVRHTYLLIGLVEVLTSSKLDRLIRGPGTKIEQDEMDINGSRTLE